MSFVLTDTGPARGEAGLGATYAVVIADSQNITLYVKGDYQSPAATATHIHEAGVGAAGPPRLAFPNPVPLDRVSGLDEFSWRASFGCLQGPFRTGLNGTDGGEYYPYNTMRQEGASLAATIIIRWQERGLVLISSRHCHRL